MPPVLTEGLAKKNDPVQFNVFPNAAHLLSLRVENAISPSRSRNFPEPLRGKPPHKP